MQWLILTQAGSEEKKAINLWDVGEFRESTYNGKPVLLVTARGGPYQVHDLSFDALLNHLVTVRSGPIIKRAF